MRRRKGKGTGRVLLYTVILAGVLLGAAGIRNRNNENTSEEGQDQTIYRESVELSTDGAKKSSTRENINSYLSEVEQTEIPSSVILDIPEILQMPELPTGCESIALTILLEYEGFELDKTTIADDYLIYSDTGEFADGYIGSPYTESGAGCFPPILVETANDYLEDQHSELTAIDVSRTDLDTLFHYVAQGHPVAVWSTMYMMYPEYIEYAVEEVGEFPWYDLEHCVVLAGYDLEEETVYISDPLEGIVERDLETFREIYGMTGMYAMLLV